MIFSLSFETLIFTCLFERFLFFSEIGGANDKKTSKNTVFREIVEIRRGFVSFSDRYIA